MTDYFPLITRAVEALDTNTGEARRAIYERARSALVTQLRSVEPALPETDITKERLALEDAIRKVEADAARKSRAEGPELRAAPPLPHRDRSISPADVGRSDVRRNVPPPSPRRFPQRQASTRAPLNAPPQSARERLLGARASGRPHESIKGFRDVVSEVHDLGAATAKSAQSARDTRDSYGPATPSWPTAEEAAPPSEQDFEPVLDAENWSSPHEQPEQVSGRASFPAFEHRGHSPTVFGKASAICRDGG